MIITIETYKDEPKYHMKASLEISDQSEIGNALEAMVIVISMLYSAEGAKEALIELAESFK